MSEDRETGLPPVGERWPSADEAVSVGGPVVALDGGSTEQDDATTHSGETGGEQ